MIADHDYFARKAEAERAAAEIAATEKARATHLELAERYRSLSEALCHHSGLLRQR
jgi:hypothetical protein